MDCVEADRLLDSANYVITPAVVGFTEKPLEDFEFECVMTREEAAPILELVSYAQVLLKEQKNKELFKKNGKSLVFYMRVPTVRNTVELQSLAVVMKKLVRGGGGRVISDRKSDKADIRIRLEENAPTQEQHQGIEWIEPPFILHCVEFNKLFDNANYVITPPLVNEKLLDDAISVLKRRVEELLRREGNKELFRKENGDSIVVFTCMKSDVVPELFHSAYDLRKRMWALVRQIGGRGCCEEREEG